MSFTVELGDTTDVGRFLLNLVLCPHINGIQVSGVPAGESVAPSDQVQQPITSETITLSVTATLADAITVPTVPGAGGGAALGAPGAMGPEGMMPGEPGMGARSRGARYRRARPASTRGGGRRSRGRIVALRRLEVCV